jgi:hypothetical protein
MAARIRPPGLGGEFVAKPVLRDLSEKLQVVVLQTPQSVDRPHVVSRVANGDRVIVAFADGRDCAPLGVVKSGLVLSAPRSIVRGIGASLVVQEQRLV